MRLLKTEGATEWCEARGIAVNPGRIPNRLGFANRDELGLRVTASREGLRAVDLANVLLRSTLGGDDDEEDFPGGLLWLQDWNMWSETTERVGLMLLERLRGTETLATDLRAAPAQLFAPSEFVLAHASLTLPILFQWDAYVIPPREGLFMFISHHGHVDVVSSSETLHERLRKKFGDSVWSSTVIRGHDIGER